MVVLIGGMLFNISNFGGGGKVLCYIKNAGGYIFKQKCEEGQYFHFRLL